MSAAAPRALVVYLEPTPYKLALVDHLQAAAPGTEHVFVSRAMSQKWEMRAGAASSLLPPGRRAALADIRRRLAAGRHDLLHIAGWGHPVLLGALVQSAMKGLPVSVESDTPIGDGRPAWRRVMKRIAYPALFRLPSVFLPAGTLQAAYLRGYGVPDRRIRIAMMTVDVDHIRGVADDVRSEEKKRRLADLGMPASGTRFLFVGRLEPAKGIPELLSAFAAVRRESAGAALIVVGDGSMRSAVEEAAARNDRIRYLGRLEGDELWRTYALADALVLPSRFEPWGLVVNEAMAAGLPVIVSARAGCVPDLVRDGENGFVVPPEDVLRLSAAMLTLCRTPVLRQSMALSGRRRIAGWTMANQAARTVGAWSEALR